jgi:restriction system protein
MALWVTRAGKHGEHEQRFLDTNRIYLNSDGFHRDVSAFQSRKRLREAVQETYPDASLGRANNFTAQMWAFAKRLSEGDWVIVPSKFKPAINVAEITGPYHFDPSADDPYNHWRTVKWIERDIPRTAFDQDLLYSFGAIQTIFQVSRNNAEKRVRAMATTGWRSDNDSEGEEAGEEFEPEVSLEDASRDQIAKFIAKKFKGHAMERLVEAVLQAQGYITYHSPAGPDKGIDLLAAPAPLGFGRPRICVQVKSGDSPVDSPTLHQLVGSMQNVQADQGLLVSWGGFKSSVDKEVPTQFFRVRLWDQSTLIDQLLQHYDRLDADLRAELPLKQVWVVSQADTE